MKLHQVLTINGKAVPLVQGEVRLDLRTPGRASFTIKAAEPVRGLVALDIGYNDRPLQRHFLGYVERCSAANATEQVLFCRELAAVLAQPLPMGLRHVDLREVLEDVCRQTGLSFRVPDADYSRTKAPYFYSLAAGYQAMDSLAQVFQIPDFVWHQQGNGEVYAGSWADSYWGARAPIQLEAELFDSYQGRQSAVIAALPGIRPGATINQGERITSVTLTGTQMAIKWKKP
ncbi:hypothetical protein ACOAQJ_12030 [Pseudomonas aeruginosa]|uniref:hypothetical protein n=1 Tax=Pseudomonas aeruginosa TaxID=287 RepID=UPI00071B3548|nr:hypothetical protein [Pseudomonas aeruginosa]KSS23070.1 hypothetical protein APB62_22045 [Pseudomonas aeruginosa]MDY1248223.1 hypothetical protein [Pseudomonas aeruginosa]HBO4017607.1 hypothetical protein [Pseudomonas aeruginosa]HCF4470160.1 hypothetical protein [Pseudomonas aeruginosa]